MYFISIIFIMFGLLAIIKPYAAWYMAIGWKIQDAEPTDIALLWYRISGILFIIVGLKTLF